MAGTIWAVLMAGAGIGVLYLRLPEAHTASSSGSPRAGDITVLFVGNSFTFVNDMPLMVDRLADAAHEPRGLYVKTQAPPGAKLSDHASDGAVAELLTDRPWDYVVLQEQSLIPSLAFERSFMLEDGSALTDLIRANGARALLYETWGYRDGAWSGDSFPAMEARTEAGYAALAKATGAQIAGVGPGFARAVATVPDLWDEDGMHPSRAGSYLAACVFYKAIYHRPVTGNSYTGGLDERTAHRLQQAADAA